MITALIVGVVVLLVLKELVHKGVPTGNYRIRGPLLTKAERFFYGVLQQAVGEHYSVFSKVRVADVLAPAKGTPKKEWRSAFNRISAKASYSTQELRGQLMEPVAANDLRKEPHF